MTELELKQNDTASEVITNEGVNNITEPKNDAVVKVEKVIDCFSAMHTFWRSCNEKLYEGLAELYGVVKDASDDEVKSICQKYMVEYEAFNHIEVIFKTTFDNAFKGELDDGRFKARFCDRRKIYKMAIKKMLEQGLTKEQALRELETRGVESVARGDKPKKNKKDKNLQCSNEVEEQKISEAVIETETKMYELTNEQKAILDAVTDGRAKNKLKSNFMIYRYNNADVMKANRCDVIKSVVDKAETLRTNSRGVKPLVVIVSCDEQEVGNPPRSNGDVDENEANNDKE